MIDTLVISDIHAGILVSRWRAVPDEVDRCNPKTVIMVGDTWDSAPTEPTGNWLAELQRIARERELVLVKGNHDWLLADAFVRQIPNAEAHESYGWVDQFRELNVAIHGHQFDPLVQDHPGLSQFATEFYARLQELTGTAVAEYLKYVSKAVSRDADRVMNGALAHGRQRHAHNVFCGHVHSYRYENGGDVNYYNDGCACAVPSSYLTIDDKGVIAYCEF